MLVNALCRVSLPAIWKFASISIRGSVEMGARSRSGPPTYSFSRVGSSGSSFISCCKISAPRIWHEVCSAWEKEMGPSVFIQVQEEQWRACVQLSGGTSFSGWKAGDWYQERSCRRVSRQKPARYVYPV